MDKKALVRLLRPVFQSLQQTGLVITDVELLPTSLKGHYTLAVSADWPLGISTMDKIKMVISRIFEFIPMGQRHYVESVFPYKSPEELESDFDSFYNYRSDGLCRELFNAPETA